MTENSQNNSSSHSKTSVSANGATGGINVNTTVAPAPPATMTTTSDSLLRATDQINQDFKEKSIKARAAASGGKYGYVDIAKIPVNPDVFLLVDYDEAEEAMAVPFFRLGMKLRLAVVDPENAKTKSIIEELKNAGFELQLNLVSEEGMKKVLENFKNSLVKEKQVIETEIAVDELEVYQKELENLARLTEQIQVSSAKEGLNLIELGAIKTGASDIHFQPAEKKALLRFRIDGILQDVSELDAKIYAQIAQQIKYESGLKLNVGHVPQDGRLSFIVNGRKIDVRVSTIPTEFGETIVMRILDSGKKFLSFVELGFSEKHLKILGEVTHLSQGMVLVTGPTGSGKTTTLYSMLNVYNIPEKKIITLEDPIEYHLDRIVQSQIDEKKGYSFSKGLESILRQDPDVVMIGEIRELQTANTALQAALTGHVMLSTLHTNSAIESIPRLINMGLDPFMIAPALDTMMAQRLARRFCPHCVTSEVINESDKVFLSSKLEEIARISGQSEALPAVLPKANGCAKCNHTGYLGRLVVAEIFRVDDNLKDLILHNRPVSELNKYLISTGNLNMELDGVLKVVSGQTSLAELRRIL